MSDPTGPRGLGDADDAGPDKGAPDTSGGDKGHGAGDVGSGGVSVHERGSGETSEPERRRWLPAFILGAVGGVVALSLVWATAATLGGTDPDGRQAAPPSATSTASASAEPSQQAALARPPSQRELCREADAKLTGQLQAAAPALDQWEIHVAAMNKLVTGEITRAQAGAFWSQSKVDASRNLARFDSAARRASSAETDCPAPGSVAQASTGLRSCATYVAQQRRALEAAGIVLRTWKAHIRDMAMEDMGHLSAAAATERWLANWQRGIRELRAYRAAEASIGGSGRC
jgi:hypothetical protein